MCACVQRMCAAAGEEHNEYNQWKKKISMQPINKRLVNRLMRERALMCRKVCCASEGTAGMMRRDWSQRLGERQRRKKGGGETRERDRRFWNTWGERDEAFVMLLNAFRETQREQTTRIRSSLLHLESNTTNEGITEGEDAR